MTLLVSAGAFAQNGGLSGINQATSMVTSYFDPATKLIYAIGAVVGLIGGVKALRLNTGYSISLLRYDESLKYYFVPVFGILLSITAFLSFLKGVKEFKEKEGTK